MTSIGSMRCILLFCAVSALFQSGTTAQSTSAHPVIVRVEKSGGHVIRTVGSKRVGSGTTNNLLYLLDDVARRQGENQPVFFYIDSRVPISEIWDLNGVAGKAQLSNLRFFILFADNSEVTEIKWSAFSKLPHVQ